MEAKGKRTFSWVDKAIAIQQGYTVFDSTAASSTHGNRSCQLWCSAFGPLCIAFESGCRVVLNVLGRECDVVGPNHVILTSVSDIGDFWFPRGDAEEFASELHESARMKHRAPLPSRGSDPCSLVSAEQASGTRRIADFVGEESGLAVCVSTAGYRAVASKIMDNCITAEGKGSLMGLAVKMDAAIEWGFAADFFAIIRKSIAEGCLVPRR
jgi:hypothetical protein